MQPKFIKSEIKLTIGILVSNRKQYIRKVMEGIRPLLEQLPSELIAVDTKGAESDGSIDIVREYTDKVYPFVWCNDFAAARNVCMEHAQGEWFLFLDDDEWFVDTRELVDFFLSGECERYKSGVFNIRNYVTEEQYSVSVVERLMRRTEQTKFVGKVHETFNLIYGPRKYFKCEIYHMGYMFINEEEKKKHQERNLVILESIMEEEGTTPKLMAQLVQEYLGVEDTISQGLAIAKEYLEQCCGTVVEKDKNVQWIISVVARRYEMDKRYEELFQWVEYAKSTFWCSPLTKLVMACVAAGGATEEKNYAVALQMALEYIEQWDWLMAHEEEKNAMLQLDSPAFLTEDYYLLMLRTGVFSANQLEEYTVAMELWNRFPWKKEGFDKAYYHTELQRTIVGLRKQQELKKEEKKEAVQLTIGMLISNRRQYIREVMEGIKPLLTQLPCELIAVDTKGAESDGSIDIVREYTDKIYPFTWCNDFSAARNVCLEHARGEWFMYLDDDECFEDVQEIIDFFQSGDYINYKSGYYYVKNGANSMAVVGRMVQRTKTTRFVGKIHETFHEIQGPSKQFSCYVNHYGYNFASDEEAKAHQVRNVSILQEELQATGETPRNCAQLTQELLHREETRDEGFRFAMEMLKKHGESQWQQDSCAQWMMLATVRYFNKKQDYPGAVKQLAHLKENYVLNEMAWLAISGTMAHLAMKHNDYDMTAAYVQRYMQAWNWKQEHEQEAMFQMNLDMPKYATPEYYQDMLSLESLAAQLQKPKLIKSDIKLTVGMLVSNHKQYIRKVMEGLKPLLDAVPSELVVIDTMGENSDGSIEIVREYTDKIYPFTWCNDFSAARNFCLDHAQGEWFLYQDDDEWFDNVQEFIDFFNSGECENYYTGCYYTKDYLPGGQYSMGIAGRIIRRTNKTRFVGKIHEHFNETFAPNKEFSCFTHHYGYAYENEEQKAAKQKRNISLLSEELKENGITPGRAAQMVQELFSREETLDEGLEFCQNSVEELEQKGQLDSALSQWMIVSLVRYYVLKGNTKKVVEQAEWLLGRYTLTPIAQMVLAANVATAAAAEEQFTMVLKYCDIYFSNADWRKEHKEESLLQINLDFPRYLTDEYYNNLTHLAAATANHLGEYQRAYRYWMRMPWRKPGFDGSRYAADMSRTLEGLKQLKEQQEK